MKLTAPQLRLFKESDVDRRRAEREVQTHGDVSSAVRVLVNRIRSGEVDEARQHRISAAASLGDPVAQAVGLPKFHEIKSDEYAVTMLRYLEPEEAINFVADCVEKVGLPKIEYLNCPEDCKATLDILRRFKISRDDALDVVDNYSELATEFATRFPMPGDTGRAISADDKINALVFEAIAYLASFIVTKFDYRPLYHSIHFLRQAGLDVNWFKQKLIDVLMDFTVVTRSVRLE